MKYSFGSIYTFERKYNSLFVGIDPFSTNKKNDTENKNRTVSKEEFYHNSEMNRRCCIERSPIQMFCRTT